MYKLNEDEFEETGSDASEETNSQSTSDESGEDDGIDWKAEAEAQRAEAAKYKRIAEQKGKKLEKTASTEKAESKQESLDYGQKAFLVANGIKGSEEMKIVEETMKISGLPLEDVIENPFVQSQIKTLRETKATENATPNGSKRTGNSTRSEVDYWLAKGELPPNTPENQELRRKVVNSKLTTAKNKSRFAQ